MITNRLLCLQAHSYIIYILLPHRVTAHRVQIFSTDARSHTVSLGVIDAFWSRLRHVITHWGYDDLFITDDFVYQSAICSSPITVTIV
jgi:hypothetical protein